MTDRIARPTLGRGHGVFQWDPYAQSYLLHWFDSMGTPRNEFRGNFEGDVLTLYCQMPQGQLRATWDFSQPNSYSHRLDAGDGQNWQPFMEGTYSCE